MQTMSSLEARRVLDALGEGTDVGHHVDTGDQTQVLSKNNKCY